MRIVMSRDPATVTVWLDTGTNGEHYEVVMDADTAEGRALDMLIDARRAKSYIATEKWLRRARQKADKGS